MTRRSIPGVAPRDEVFGAPHGLPGQVFAAEILERPVVLRRTGRVVEVTIDRRGVRDAVYTTEGKNGLCRQALTGETLELARRLERDIHRFLMGNSEDPAGAPDATWEVSVGGVASAAGATRAGIEIPVPRIPLRWASGGVLPVVTWRGGVWFPFFFRDIAPVGWNIAAGSSEAEAELCRPQSFGLREFLEETIVLPQPPRPGAVIRAKTFPRIMDGVLDRREREAQVRSALARVNRHLEIRSREDGLDLVPFPDGPCSDDRAIDTTAVPTCTRLRIVNGDGAVAELDDVLVCFNLLELGIEVMTVVTFDLGEDEYLLDGETLSPVGGPEQLIRMPVAMISRAYLEDVLGGADPLDFESPALIEYDRDSGGWENVPAGQPSVRVKRPPAQDRGEIVVFPWDVGRRAELARGNPGDRTWMSDPMRIRHRRWGKNFTKYFAPGEGGRAGEMGGTGKAAGEGCPFFTAGAAKSVAYHFRNAKGT